MRFLRMFLFLSLAFLSPQLLVPGSPVEAQQASDMPPPPPPAKQIHLKHVLVVGQTKGFEHDSVSAAMAGCLTEDIDVHFSGVGEGTLVVVAFGRNVYAATGVEPLAALHAAASKAAEGLAQRGLTVDARVIVEKGQEKLLARGSGSSRVGLQKPSTG